MKNQDCSLLVKALEQNSILLEKIYTHLLQGEGETDLEVNVGPEIYA